MIICLQHITAEGTTLIQQAEEAASNQVQHLLILFGLILSASLFFQLIIFFPHFLQTTSGSGVQEQASLLTVLVSEYIILVIAGEV